MATGSYVMLGQRGVLAVEGDDGRSFLQGLISNDIDKVTPEKVIYAALLTPQGKYLFDFIVARFGERLLLETEADRLPALRQRLMMYKLRAAVDIADVSEDLSVVAFPGKCSLDGLNLAGERTGTACILDDGIVFVDPRLAELGARAILPAASAMSTLSALGLEPMDHAGYDRLRLDLGVPAGSDDLVVDKATLLESGFEELNGVDFDKGCFVGQELTARMKYRALVRKRLMPVTFKGPSPSPGTIIKAGSREIGEMRTSIDGRGLALLRLDRLKSTEQQGEELVAGETILTPATPPWANF